MFRLPVVELFSSLQGEGPYVGVRQIFLRLPECNLDCPYCDTKSGTPVRMRAERSAGTGAFSEIDNPVSLKQLLDLLGGYDISRHHSLSVTGGEPLLWADELRLLLPLVKELGLSVYLETNGTLPEQLPKVAEAVDIVSMDVKLPFAGKRFWDEHKAFLQNCRGKEVFVKIVVSRDTPRADLERASDLIAGEDVSITTVLQPVTERGGVRAPEGRQILEWQDLLLGKLKDVRVIPQTHVWLRVL